MKQLYLAAMLAAASISASASINLFVVNDGGRNGAFDQPKVAATLGRMAEQVEPEAIIAIGDTHHYMGVQSTSDPLWLTNYELVYSHPELQIPWFPVLGNHEYVGNSQAVIDYSNISRRWQMPDRYYSKCFVDDKSGSSVRVVFIDTTPLIDKYRRESDEYPDVAGQSIERQLQWLDSTLQAATEDWVIMVGHHPIYGQTSKNETERTDLQKRLLPIINRHKVDMCIAGHIHNFQHIEKADGRIYIVNGSASQNRQVKPTDGTRFCSPATGFSIIEAEKGRLTLKMLDAEGNVIHTVTRQSRR